MGSEDLQIMLEFELACTLCSSALLRQTVPRVGYGQVFASASTSGLSVVWGWGLYFRDSDSCAATLVYPFLSFWRWRLGRHPTTSAFPMQRSLPLVFLRPVHFPKFSGTPFATQISQSGWRVPSFYDVKRSALGPCASSGGRGASFGDRLSQGSGIGGTGGRSGGGGGGCPRGRGWG